MSSGVPCKFPGNVTKKKSTKISFDFSAYPDVTIALRKLNRMNFMRCIIDLVGIDSKFTLKKV